MSIFWSIITSGVFQIPEQVSSEFSLFFASKRMTIHCFTLFINVVFCLKMGKGEIFFVQTNKYVDYFDDKIFKDIQLLQLFIEMSNLLEIHPNSF